MATFHIPISCSVTTGSSSFKVKYRLAGDPTWNVNIIPPPPTSGTTATVHGLDNRIYDIQVQNINEADNPLSLITQIMGITDPSPVITPTANAAGYSFSNLSQDIDSYTVQLTTVADPGTILATHVLPPGVFPNTISDQFTGLLAMTAYRLVITPVANQFSSPFIHTFITSSTSQCADVTGVIVALR